MQYGVEAVASGEQWVISDQWPVSCAFSGLRGTSEKPQIELVFVSLRRIFSVSQAYGAIILAEPCRVEKLKLLSVVTRPAGPHSPLRCFRLGINRETGIKTPFSCAPAACGGALRLQPDWLVGRCRPALRRTQIVFRLHSGTHPGGYPLRTAAH